jgi:hypothetical protein
MMPLLKATAVAVVMAATITICFMNKADMTTHRYSCDNSETLLHSVNFHIQLMTILRGTGHWQFNK